MKLKTEKEIEALIQQIEKHLFCDISFRDIKKFPFYGEVNTDLTTTHGIRKILLWVLDKQPRQNLSKDAIDKPG